MRGHQQPVLFCHIPKSGGLALRRALARSLDAVAIEGFDRCLYGTFAAWDTVAPAARNEVFGIGEFAFPRDAKLVAGHFAVSTLRSQYPTGALLTLLREPISRLLSLWTFWRGHYGLMEGWGAWSDVVYRAAAPLADFLTDSGPCAQTDNVAVRMLLWPHPLIPAGAPIADRNDAELLDAAWETLQSFAFVDVIENPQWPARLAAWLGSAIQPMRENETAAPPKDLSTDLASELTPTSMDLLRRCTRLDEELWRRVAAQRLPAQQVESARMSAAAAAVARHALLLSA